MGFTNRQSEHLNRKKLKIISQTPTEIIADIERADDAGDSTGTPINAEVFNSFQQQITTASNNATQAQATATTAKTTSEEAKQISAEAIQKANTAINDSDIAKTNSATALDNSKTALSSATLADEKATSAINLATNADTNANKAVTQADTATSNANSAITASESAITKAEQAISDSGIAKTKAEQAVSDASLAKSNSTTALNNATEAKSIATDASSNANSASTNASEAKELATEAKELATEAISTSETAKTKAEQAISDSKTAKESAERALTSFENFQATSEILKVAYSPTVAEWACSDVNTLPTTFGVNATGNSNVKFSSDGTAKTNVVIDGDFYGQDGQKKVAYKSDIPTKTSSLTNDSNFITSSASITGNANTATRSSILSGADTRNANSNPEYYFSKAIGFVCEFKQGSVIGLSSYSYVLLITNAPWSDASGGLPSQVAYAPDGKMYIRNATSATAWGSWKDVVLNPYNQALIVGSTAQNISGGLPQTGRAAGQAVLTKDCLAIFNPSTGDDAGWIRVTGSGESDTVLEIATGDDSGSGEAIVVRQYNTSNAVARQATLLGTDGNTSFPGNLTTGGYVNANSDIRLKENIDDINEESVKDFIENTQIKAFNYIENGNRTVGIIAQDIEKKEINNAFFTSVSVDGFLQVHETKFTYLLWNYCQQLNNRIKELESKVK